MRKYIVETIFTIFFTVIEEYVEWDSNELNYIYKPVFPS